MRILIGPFKLYSGLLYEAHLRPMMVNIHTFGIYASKLFRGWDKQGQIISTRENNLPALIFCRHLSVENIVCKKVKIHDNEALSSGEPKPIISNVAREPKA